MNSLHPDYARFYDKYYFIEFLFEIAEARYDVLASFLLSYLNRHSYTLFRPCSAISSIFILRIFLIRFHFNISVSSLTAI